MTVLLSVKVADRWCWEAREGRPVKSSGRPTVASGAAGVAVCPGVEAEDTEVSLREGRRFFLEGPENKLELSSMTQM